MFEAVFREYKIGSFLKNWAKFWAAFSIVVGVILVFIGFIVWGMDTEYNAGIMGICIGCGIGYFLITFVQSIFLYAVGTLVDSSAMQYRLIQEQTELLNKIAQGTSGTPDGSSQPAKDDTLPPL